MVMVSVVRRADAILTDAAWSDAGGDPPCGVVRVDRSRGRCRGLTRFAFLICAAILGPLLLTLADDLTPLRRGFRQARIRARRRDRRRCCGSGRRRVRIRLDQRTAGGRMVSEVNAAGWSLPLLDRVCAGQRGQAEQSHHRYKPGSHGRSVRRSFSPVKGNYEESSTSASVSTD